jgi:cystathionine gamma-synthase
VPDYRHPETLAVHAGRVTDPATGALVPPIYLSTTFEREADGTYPRGYAYTTFNNPNRAWLESAVAELESGAAVEPDALVSVDANVSY